MPFKDKNLDKKLNINPDYIVYIPTTCPLRKVSDIDNCIRKAIKNKLDIVFTITSSAKNPYFNILEKKRGKLNIVSKTGLAWNFKNEIINACLKNNFAGKFLIPFPNDLKLIAGK